MNDNRLSCVHCGAPTARVDARGKPRHSWCEPDKGRGRPRWWHGIKRPAKAGSHDGRLA